MKEQLTKVTEGMINELKAKNAPAELVSAIEQARDTALERIDNYHNETLKGNLNEMWYCEFSNKYNGKSLFRSAFSAIVSRA